MAYCIILFMAVFHCFLFVAMPHQRFELNLLFIS